jgi:hypothetical protein
VMDIINHPRLYGNDHYWESSYYFRMNSS